MLPELGGVENISPPDRKMLPKSEALKRKSISRPEQLQRWLLTFYARNLATTATMPSVAEPDQEVTSRPNVSENRYNGPSYLLAAARCLKSAG